MEYLNAHHSDRTLLAVATGMLIFSVWVLPLEISSSALSALVFIVLVLTSWYGICGKFGSTLGKDSLSWWFHDTASRFCVPVRCVILFLIQRLYLPGYFHVKVYVNSVLLVVLSYVSLLPIPRDIIFLLPDDGAVRIWKDFSSKSTELNLVTAWQAISDLPVAKNRE